MVHFDPDSSERKPFKLFEDQQQQNTGWSVVSTTLQIVLIISVLRLFMLESGRPFFYIPVLDDLYLSLLYEVKELLHLYFPNFRP